MSNEGYHRRKKNEWEQRMRSIFSTAMPASMKQTNRLIKGADKKKGKGK